MKTKLQLLIAAILLTASAMFAESSDWFISPTYGAVFPSSSGITYHGYSGTVDYKDGYTVGLDAGRYFFNNQLKTYISYDYTSYQDKGFTLSTPYGKVYQSDNSNYNGQTLMANADYIFQKGFLGIKPLFGVGVGATFDGGDNATFEGRFSLRKDFAGFTISTAFASRLSQGSITSGHVSVEEPRQERIEFKLSKSF